MGIKQRVIQALVASLVVACTTVASAQAPSTQAIVGTWNLTLTSPQGTHPGTVTIKDEAGKLAGAMTGGMGSTPVDVKTTVSGVSLSFSVDYQGQPLPIVLAGKVDGSAIKGTVDYGNGAATGEFTGTKVGAAAGAAVGATVGATLTGWWDITGDGGSGYSFNFTQDGTAVTGVLKTPDGLELPVTGTFENNALSLTLSMDGAAGTIKGALDGTALKGAYDIAGDAGSFSATRKP